MAGTCHSGDRKPYLCSGVFVNDFAVANRLAVQFPLEEFSYPWGEEGVTTCPTDGSNVVRLFRTWAPLDEEALVAFANSGEFRERSVSLVGRVRSVSRIWFDWVSFDLLQRKAPCFVDRPVVGRDLWGSCFDRASLEEFITVESFVRRLCHSERELVSLAAVDVWCVLAAHLGMRSSDTVELRRSVKRYWVMRGLPELGVAEGCENGLSDAPVFESLTRARVGLAYREALAAVEFAAIEGFRKFWDHRSPLMDARWRPVYESAPQKQRRLKSTKVEMRNIHIRSCMVPPCREWNEKVALYELSKTDPWGVGVW